jgi:hypothetical protein
MLLCKLLKIKKSNVRDIMQSRSIYKAVRQLLVLVVLSAMLAACGSGGGGTPTPVQVPPPPPLAPGSFVDVTASSGIRFSNGVINPPSPPDLLAVVPSGVASGDYDNDGDIDLFIVRGDVGPNLLYRNSGNLVFEDVADAAGLAFTQSATENYSHSGPMFADIDGDGDLDIYHTNGWSLTDEFHNFSIDTSRAFVANGAGQFEERSAQLGLVDTEQGRGVVCADFDNDGDTDILQLHRSADVAATLWRNDVNSNNFLSVKLIGAPPNTEASGARITITVAGATQMREISIASNFVSQNPTVQAGQFLSVDHPDL